MDENRIKLFFESFAINLFGINIVEKELDAKGVWKMIYVGEIDLSDEAYAEIDLSEVLKSSSYGKNNKILLRVMRTPNLYILAKEL